MILAPFILQVIRVMWIGLEKLAHSHDLRNWFCQVLSERKTDVVVFCRIFWPWKLVLFCRSYGDCSLRVSCPILFEFLICPDARLKPQGLGGSYLQRVLRGFRMSIHLMFHVFAAFLAASFWSACAVFVYKINTCGPLGPFLFGFLPLCFSCVFSDKGRISPEFEPVAH